MIMNKLRLKFLLCIVLLQCYNYLPVNANSCSSDLDCKNNKNMKCDLLNGSCVECTNDLDCKDQFKPICNLESFTCQACINDKQCQALKFNETNEYNYFVCDKTKGNCENKCETNDDCFNGLSCKNNQCQMCNNDQDCLNTKSENKKCSIIKGICVECFDNSVCLEKKNNSVCISYTNKCSDCAFSPDCPENKQICLNRKCFGCLYDTDCTKPNTHCDLTKNICVDGCTKYSCKKEEKCYSFNATCVECTTNKDCSYLCDFKSQKCVKCTQDKECLIKDSNLKKCSSNQCVECESNGDCDKSKPNCDNNKCYECTNDNQCSGKYEKCKNFKCVQYCYSDNSCDSLRPNCLTRNNTCFRCSDNFDCYFQSNQKCNKNGLCAQCLNHDDCRYSTPYCSNEGSCVECLINDDCDKEICKNYKCVIGTATASSIKFNSLTALFIFLFYLFI